MDHSADFDQVQIGDRDEQSDDLYKDDFDSDDYDTDINLPEVTIPPVESTEGRPLGVRTRVEILRDAVNSYYDKIEIKYSLDPIVRDYTKFIVDTDGKIHLKEHAKVNLVNKRTGSPLSFQTVSDNLPWPP